MKALLSFFSAAGFLLLSGVASAETQPDWYETRCNAAGCMTYACSHTYGCRPLFPVYFQER
jgi:hypothetical protein